MYVLIRETQAQKRAFFTKIRGPINTVLRKQYSVEDIAKGFQITLGAVESAMPVHRPAAASHQRRDADAYPVPEYYDDPDAMWKREAEASLFYEDEGSI